MKNIQPIIGWKINKQVKVPANAAVRYFDWSEFSVGGFFPFIIDLVKLSGDNEFYFYDLDVGMTGDIEKYYEHFAQYPLVKINVSATEEEYLAELGKRFYIEDYFIGDKKREDGLRHCLFMVSATCNYVMFSESMNWHIYGEYDIELARLVSKVGLPKDVPFPHEFIPEDEAKRLIALKK